MNAYLFTSEIYRLLGELDPVTLRELSSFELAPEIADIVEKFRAARFSRVPLQAPSDLTAFPATHQPQIHPSSISGSSATRDIGGVEESEVVNSVIQDYSEHLTNDHLVTLLGRAGLEIEPRAKESRGSLVHRVKRALKEMRIDRRERVLRNFVRLAQIGETEGWMRVIQSRKD